MPTFASVYRPPISHQSFLTREQKRGHKRKRDANDEYQGGKDGESAFLKEQSSDPEDDDTLRVPHPVNRTDPYYVAGHPRERPLHSANFPHAAIKDGGTSERPVEEELANLNPPLYVPKLPPQDQSGSLKRRHLDNLTAILHKCMLTEDWDRASRVWGLILRTEIQGHGPDARHNGRWMIGAELLMRRTHSAQQQPNHPSTSTQDIGPINGQSRHQAAQFISDEGFRLARDYYERLIIQFPHRARALHSEVNALAIYPALFNVWIYEVQDRANRARQAVNSNADDFSEMDSKSPGGSVKSDSSNIRRTMHQIESRELHEAMPIASRMDDLMRSPPYDNSSEMLHTRGMLGLWLADLHNDVSQSLVPASSGNFSEDEDLNLSSRQEVRMLQRRHKQQADTERSKAKKMFEQLIAAEVDVPDHVRAFLEDDHSASLDDDTEEIG